MYAHTLAVGIVPCHTVACWPTSQHCAWSTSCAVYCGIHGSPGRLTQTAGVLRRPVPQLALMYSRGVLWHPPPSSQTTAVVRRTVRRQLALMYAHTWAVGMVPCHTMACWQTRQPSIARGQLHARSTVASTAAFDPHTRRRTKARTRAAGPSVCARSTVASTTLASRASDVVRWPVRRQLALMYAHTWSIGINPCHTGKLGDCPAQHAVDLVRGLLWHPRPPLTQTPGVVRRPVRRQLALMYAHTWAVGIVPCHTVVCWPTSQHCAWSTSCALYCGIHCSPGRLTQTAGVVRRPVPQLALMYSRAPLWHPRPSSQTTAVVRWTARRQLALMYAPTWAVGIVPCHITACWQTRQPSISRGQLHARSTMASKAAFDPHTRRRTKARTQAAGPNVCAHLGCRDCSMSHRGLLADKPALRVVHFVRGVLWHPLQSRPADPDSRRRTKARTTAGTNVFGSTRYSRCDQCSLLCCHVNVDNTRAPLWHPSPSSQTTAVVRWTVRRQLALMYAHTWAVGIVPCHITACWQTRQPSIARGQLHAWSTVASTAAFDPHTRRRTKARTPAAGPNVCAHLGCRDCSMSHRGLLADKPALRVVHFVRGLLWHPRPSLDRTSDVVRRPVCRQLALSIRISPCHTGRLDECPAQHVVDILRGLLWHPRSSRDRYPS
ncbi:uncharacterized protein [Dermacentor albipictus]|uniref:uncharacterized protein isoform X2 n=1 Tax=Dermacentor albipictus TaxID=60249 RepID=UPI0038FC2AF2